MESAPSQKILETSFLHRQEAGWKTPLIQSSITGGLITTILIIIMIRSGAQVIDILTWAGMTFCFVTLGMWFYLLWSWLSLTMERVTGRDWNGDGVIGPVIGPEIIRPVRVDVINGNVTDRASFEDGRKFVSIADGIIKDGATLSQREMVSVRKLVTRSEFDRIYAEMLARGLITLKNPEHPNLGHNWTEGGMAVMRDAADHPEGFV